MTQSPGLLVADTKFDLAVDPAAFLGRALHLWDPIGAFGQLQNQAYGYLWPMGPFFLLGSALDLPGWVVQRLWLALVMCVAFTGAAKLTRLTGARSDLACLLAGFAYALSPRMLTTLGPISIEAWPSALAPWVLVPLVIGSYRGSPRRAAALAGLVVAMVGGVNAAATFAVLPLGVLWLLTREPGPRRRRLMLWWPVFTLLGTLWWLVPLFVMGAYSPPFLDFIESASNTTFSTDLFDALRGTSDWVPYVDTDWRAGNDLIREFYLPLNSGLVLALGLAGMLVRRNLHRVFLGTGVLLGLLLVTMGHLGPVQGLVAPDLQRLLDDALAPFRNVHKFDLVLRLPLVLGLGWFVEDVVSRVRARAGHGATSGGTAPWIMQRTTNFMLVGVAVLVVLGAATPAVTGRLAPAGGTFEIPQYWRQAAAWLGERDGRTLLAPGSSFGDYVWGSPHDEPLQSLATKPWAVRNAVPLAPAGNIRMLDAVEERLAQGEPSPGLAPYLRRAGITHVVVRNDLVRSSDLPDPVLVHQALGGSPGLDLVATFGPSVGGDAVLATDDGRVVINGGWQSRYPAIEIYQVADPAPFASTSDVLPVVVGGPEDLLALSDLGVLGSEPTTLAVDADPSAPTGGLVLTDGLRDVERHFGRVHDATSATRAEGDPRRLGNPTADYVLERQDQWSTRARLDGADRVDASSSMADASANGPVERGAQPYAAVDGQKETAWTSNYDVRQPAWWQIDLQGPMGLHTIMVSAGPDADEVVRIRAGAAASDEVAIPAGGTREVQLDPTTADSVRIEDASGKAGHRLSLAEVTIPGVTVRRSLELPTLPDEWGSPDTVVLRAVADARSGCAVVATAVRCVPGREVAGEEPLGFRRTLSLPVSDTYMPQLRVRGRPGAELQSLLLRDQPAGVTASSVAVPDARASAIAAVDGDRGTTWTAAVSDLRPRIELRWLGERRVSGLHLALDPGADARLPRELHVTWPGGSRTVRVTPGGLVHLPSIRTDQLSLSVLEAAPATNLNFDQSQSPVPVGISEVAVRGVPFFPIVLPRARVRYPCGAGPVLTVNGEPRQTSVAAAPADLYEGRTVTATVCGPRQIGLTSGENQVDAVASDAFTPLSLVLTSQTRPDATLGSATWTGGVTQRSIDPAMPAGTLVLKQNANAGWQAVQDGRTLDPSVVDGWQQAWTLRDGQEVDVRFRPDLPYRLGLGLGVAGLLGLLVGALAGSRRSGDDWAAPVAPRVVPGIVQLGAAAAGGALLASWLGVVVATVSWLLAAVLARRAPGSGLLVTLLVLLPAALAYAVRPWGGSSGWAGELAWPQYLVVAAASVVLGWSTSPLERPRFRSRIAGRSTQR